MQSIPFYRLGNDWCARTEDRSNRTNAQKKQNCKIVALFSTLKHLSNKQLQPSHSFGCHASRLYMCRIVVPSEFFCLDPCIDHSTWIEKKIFTNIYLRSRRKRSRRNDARCTPRLAPSSFFLERDSYNRFGESADDRIADRSNGLNESRSTS